jgi:hypothetical protein
LSSQQDKDRFVVLLFYNGNYFFWGAFEQAGGLMKLIRMLKQGRYCYLVGDSYVMFQSLNAQDLLLAALV